MRKSFFLHSAALLLAVVSPAVASAQFQKPTDEELKMTSDPKAPGAAAVYLDIEENDGLEPGFSEYYARIKVLAEKGKELATVEVPYFKGCEQIARIKGRTIHPDGTIVPLDVKPEDLLLIKSRDERVQRKVFTLPSVEVGSILEYRYETQYTPCGYYIALTWDVQKPYFVHKAHYAYSPSGPAPLTAGAHGVQLNFIVLSQTLPPGVRVKLNAMGHYVLDFADIPPIPNEEWMPPLRDAVYQVHFDYSHVEDIDSYAISQEKIWWDNLRDFAAPSRSIRAAVASLISPGDSDLDKAKKLYTAVQAFDNTDYSRKKTEAERRELKLKETRRAADIWEQKSGSRNDLALLYLSMLRTAGLTAYAMKVTDRDQGTYNPNRADFDLLDSVLVILSSGGKEIYLDPGEKMCPFGVLSWKHAGAGGLRESADGNENGNTPSPPYTQNTTLRTGDLDVDAQGKVSGTLRFVMSGQTALYWRQEALENDDTELKKEFDDELQAMVPEGVEAHVNHFVGLNEPDQYLMAMIDVKGSLGAATAKRLVLPSFFLETRGNMPFIHEEKRQTPVDMHYDAIVTDQVTYRLPEGLKLEGAPTDVKELWKDHAVYNARIRSASGEITTERSLARAFTLAKPEEYQDLRGFYQKVATADQAQLVLTIAPTASAAPASTAPAVPATQAAPAGKGN
jgi:hypothetical protein